MAEIAAVAAAAAVGVGQAVSAVAQSNALRTQAKQEKASGKRLLAQQTAMTRRESGQFAVDAFSSGLTGGSFGDVFTSQELEDAEFLGSIKQDTQNRVDNLRQASKNTLIVGLTKAAASTFQGVAGVKANQAALARQKAVSSQTASSAPRSAGGGAFNPGGFVHGGSSSRDPFTN